MPRLAYLHDPGRSDDDASARLLPPAFAGLGWQVDCFDCRSLAVQDGTLLLASTGHWPAAGSANNSSSNDHSPTLQPLGQPDLIWIGGLGPQASFLDRMQLLASLPAQRFVNRPDSLVMLHGKLALGWLPSAVPQPAVHASTDAAALLAQVATGGRWVAKPPAGSQGREVYLLQAGDSNCRAILEHLTGHGSHLALLQPWVPAAQDGELRALLAAGELVGCYHRKGIDHRNNLHRGGTATAAQPDPQQRAILATLAQQLLTRGVAWAGIDLAGETVLEVNLACPGGLGTLAGLGDPEAALRAAQAVSLWCGASGAG